MGAEAILFSELFFKRENTFFYKIYNHKRYNTQIKQIYLKNTKHYATTHT